jgi:Uma2 family endonuclease
MSVTVRTKKKRRLGMTTGEYLQTPETVLPRELAYGELRIAESPSVSHQRVVVELTLALVPYVRQRQLGEMFVAPMDVILDFDRALVVQPDLLFVSRERSHIVSDRIYGAPDLVVEVLSPHPRIGRLEERVGWFANAGVRECWLANTVEKTVAVLTLTNGGVGARTLHRGPDPIRTDVLDGVQLTPLDVFGW